MSKKSLCLVVAALAVLVLGALACNFLHTSTLPHASPSLQESDAHEMSVLSFNIHGLPPLLTMDRSELRMDRMLPLLHRFDIAALQENFIYTDILKDSCFETIYGNASRFGFFALPLIPFCGDCGSGLSTYIKKGRGAVVEHVATPYVAPCSGWLNKRNDCFVSKGFLKTTVLLGDGERIIVYNTHLDAGRDPTDVAARSRQIEILQANIAAESPVLPVIVAGDFNQKISTLEPFVQSLGLREAVSNLDGQHIDYIFYRSGDTLRIIPHEGGYASEFDTLSDHRAIYALFHIDQ